MNQGMQSQVRQLGSVTASCSKARLVTISALVKTTSAPIYVAILTKTPIDATIPEPFMGLGSWGFVVCTASGLWVWGFGVHFGWNRSPNPSLTLPPSFCPPSLDRLAVALQLSPNPSQASTGRESGGMPVPADFVAGSYRERRTQALRRR